MSVFFAMKTVPFIYPSYSRSERKADYAIHIIGIVVAPIASAWLLRNSSGPLSMISLTVYCVGLIAVLSTSALYNMFPQHRWKEFVRRGDHAVIFVMIAGTYTPLTTNRLEWLTGSMLAVFVWIVAVFGVMLSLLRPHQYARLRFALYLLLGWTVVVVIQPLSSEVKPATLLLLVTGGLAYSIGAGIHLLDGVRFHNAVWHALVLLAASLHFLAMATEFVT
jgi:hemolysin III